MAASSRPWPIRVAFGLLLAALLAYPADWLLWHARGAPTEQLTVTRLVVAPLKGNKEEYYPDGTDTVTCSNSFFPETGTGPCWYARNHPVLYER